MRTKKERQERLTEIKEDICDNYCKYPGEYFLLYEDPEVGHDTMIEDVCSECPLNNLME